MLLIVITLNIVLIPTTYCDSPIVKLPQGIVKGTYKTSYDGNIFSAFEGIPFAKPPIGNLRFQEPQPPAKWKKVLLANKAYACLQFNALPYFRKLLGTEDCLYIYVYVPTKQINPNNNYDVIVHIHAGGFTYGSPKLSAHPEFIIDGNIIFVTFNYRLGIFGFLSTEDNVVPGNNGLKDQVMALRWIKTNIEYFGGNPNSITITGLSSGAASVHFHYLSPLSKGLFHKGFSQSGTALNPIFLNKNPLNKAKFVANQVGCPTNSTVQMVNCLKMKKNKALVFASVKLYQIFYLSPICLFGPVIEKVPNGFLTEHPYKILKYGDVYDVPWITSNVQDDGLGSVSFVLGYKALNLIDRNWNELAPHLLEINDTVNDDNKVNVVNTIRKHYMGSESFTYNNLKKFIQMISDRFFLTETEKSLRLQASRNKATVYYYFYRYLRDLPSALPSYNNSVSHDEDAELLFRFLITPMKLSKNDKDMMKTLVDFIVTFAKTGVPRFNNVTWTSIVPNSTKINYLDITSANLAEMKSKKTLSLNTEFWKTLPIQENDNLY